jgi:hypothetical protein
MATITIDLKDEELLDLAGYIAEAYGTAAPKDLADACDVVYDWIMADRKGMTEHILDKRMRAAAAASADIKAKVAAATVPPTRKT